MNRSYPPNNIRIMRLWLKIFFYYLDEEDDDEDLELLDPVLFLATSMLSTWIIISEAMRAKIKIVAQQNRILVILLFFSVVFSLSSSTAQLVEHFKWNHIISYMFFVILWDTLCHYNNTLGFISKCIHLIEVLFQMWQKL